MLTKLEQTKNMLRHLGKEFSVFFYGGYFPVYIGLVVTFCHVANLPLFGLTLVSLSVSIILLCYRDTTPIIPLLFMVILVFNDFSIMNGIMPYIALLPAILSFFAHFYLYPIKHFKKGKLFNAFIVITIALICGGAFTSGYNFFLGIASVISLGPTMLIIYLFFSLTINPPKGFKIKKYICYCFVVTGLTMITHAVTNRIINPANYGELGWININGIAAFLCLSVPCCYYLIINAKRILPFLIILICLYAGIVITGSDAVLIIVVLFSPIMIYYTYRNIHRKYKIFFSRLIMISALLVAVFALGIIVIKGVDSIINFILTHSSDNGRKALYEEALLLFSKNPLFGIGLGYVKLDSSLITTDVRIYNFHSTLLHVLATMGLVGLTAYIFYFYKRFQVLLKEYNTFTIFAALAFIMFECYAMVDTGEFNAIPLMSAVTVLILIVENFAKEKDSDFTSLPLSLNRKGGYNF